MAFTFDPQTDRGKVRLLIGDTEAATAVLDDASVDYFLDEEDGVDAAAVAACEAIARRYAHQADFTQDDTSIKAGERAKTWQSMAESLRARVSGNAIRTMRTQRTDGYSDSIPNRGVSGTLERSGRDGFYVGHGRGT